MGWTVGRYSAMEPSLGALLKERPNLRAKYGDAAKWNPLLPYHPKLLKAALDAQFRNGPVYAFPIDSDRACPLVGYRIRVWVYREGAKDGFEMGYHFEMLHDNGAWTGMPGFNGCKVIHGKQERDSSWTEIGDWCVLGPSRPDPYSLDYDREVERFTETRKVLLEWDIHIPEAF